MVAGMVAGMVITIVMTVHSAVGIITAAAVRAMRTAVAALEAAGPIAVVARAAMEAIPAVACQAQAAVLDLRWVHVDPVTLPVQ